MRRADRTGQRAAIGALALAACASPQLLGGARAELLPLIAALLLVALGLAVWASPPAVSRAALPFVVVVPLAWTIVQALPFPCGWIAGVDPEGVDTLRRALALVGAGEPGPCTLSRDPGATRREVVEGSLIAAGFFAGWLAAARGRRRAAYFAVAASCVAMAVVAMAHTALGAPSVFGLYRPVYVRDAPAVAPLLNPNTLGGFLAPGVPLAAGLALTVHDRLARALWAIAAAVLAAATFLSGSRGAAIAVCLGAGVLALLAWRRPKATDPARRFDPERTATAAGLVLLLGLAGAWSYTQIEAEFRQGGTGKLALVTNALAFSAEHAWLGVGRGAFASAFPRAHPSSHNFAHAESFVAEWAVEWGWPVTLLLLAGIGAGLRRTLGVRRSLATLGAVAALVAAAAHNALDVGLELPGVACVWAILLGAVSAPSRRDGSRPGESPAPLHLARGVLVTGLASLALLGPDLARDDADSQIATLRARAHDAGDPAFDAVLARAVPLHPGRPELAVLAAEHALARGDPAAGRWINRGMQLAPGWAAPHVQAMRWLWRAGRRDQAIVEAGLAAERDVHEATSYLCALVLHDAAAVAHVAPRGAPGILFLETASRCLPADSEQGRQVDAVLAARSPGHAWSAARNAERALAANDPEAALRLARSTASRAPHETLLALLEARALVALDRAGEAIELLRREEARAEDPAPLVEFEARTHAARRDTGAMREALERLRGRAGSRSDRLASAMLLEGDLEAGLGNLVAALQAYERAHRITHDITALERAAETAERLGDLRRARSAWSTLCELAPERGGCARRDALLRRSP